MLSNNPPVDVTLPGELVQFALDNCNVNIAFGLGWLQQGGMTDAEAHQLVERIEQFKQLRDLIQEAMK